MATRFGLMSTWIGGERARRVARSLRVAGYAATIAGCTEYVSTIVDRMEPMDGSARDRVVGLVADEADQRPQHVDWMIDDIQATLDDLIDTEERV